MLETGTFCNSVPNTMAPKVYSIACFSPDFLCQDCCNGSRGLSLIFQLPPYDQTNKESSYYSTTMGRKNVGNIQEIKMFFYLGLTGHISETKTYYLNSKYSMLFFPFSFSKGRKSQYSIGNFPTHKLNTYFSFPYFT